jgi:hypothetical protein
MKTKDFADALRAFAEIAAPPVASELRALALVFDQGKEETLAARVKKFQVAQGAPSLLRNALQSMASCFKVSGASKQASAMAPVVQFVLNGRDDLSSDEFVARITALPPPTAPKKKVKPPEVADADLAQTLAATLTATILDKAAFGEVVKKLRSAKQVNTPTLALTARLFLSNQNDYVGRKEALDAIIARQKADAREHARGQALKRVGV